MPLPKADDLFGSSINTESALPKADDLFGSSAQSSSINDLYNYGKETISNIPKSGLEFGKNIYTAIRHPIETTKAIGTTALGGIEKLIPGQQQSEQSFDSVVNFFKQRYGGIENLKNTIKTDPVGFAADLSTVLSGAGGIAGKLPAFGKVGSVLSKAGEITDPLKAAVSVAAPVAKFAGSRAAEALGLSTGVGGEVIKEAFAKPTIAAEQMRNKVPDIDIVEKAKESLNAIKEKRSADYVSKLEKIKQDPQIFENTFIDLNTKLDEALNKFKVQINPDGGLDFSRSPVSKAGQAKVEEAVNTIKSWGNNPDDFKPAGLDLLKRKLDDLIPDTGEAKAFITPLKQEIRKTLVKNVPEYESMVKGYEQASNTLKDIQQSLSLGTKAQADTTLRKLTSVLRQNFEFRKSMVNKLEEVGGKDIIPQIAGQQLSTWEPRGLVRGVAGGALGTAGLMAIKGLMNPQYLGIFALSSPRVIGEFVTTLGLGKQAANRLIFEAKKYGALNPNIYKSSFQAGRLKEQVEKKQ